MEDPEFVKKMQDLTNNEIDELIDEEELEPEPELVVQHKPDFEITEDFKHLLADYLSVEDEIEEINNSKKKLVESHKSLQEKIVETMKQHKIKRIEIKNQKLSYSESARVKPVTAAEVLKALKESNAALVDKVSETLKNTRVPEVKATLRRTEVGAGKTKKPTQQPGN